MKKKADASILAANYNNGPFLVEFIDSILNSSVMPAKIIIVDDASTDDSRSVLTKYEGTEHFSIVYLEKNIGFGNALNRGMEEVDTEFVLRADPDDRLHPKRIERQLGFLRQHKELSGLGSNVEYFDGRTGRPLLRSNFPGGEKEVSNAYRQGEHGMQHPSVALRVDSFLQYRYRQEKVPAEDYDIFARMVADGHRFTNLPEALHSMRIHPGSVSSNLEYSTIRLTYELRDEIFGTRTPAARIKRYYHYMKHYRQGLLAPTLFRRYLHFALAAAYFPEKALKRIKRG